MKKTMALLLASAMVLSLAGCNTYTGGDETTQAETAANTGKDTGSKESAAQSSEQAAGSRELRIGASTDVISLDTNVINDNNSGEVLYHTSEGLLRNLEEEIVPGMAESYEVSDDGLTYTFHLRDAKWEDGEPVTADQFVYSFRRFLDPATGATEYDKFLSIANAKEIADGTITDLSQLGVKAEDEKTLVVTLSRMSPTFIASLASSDCLYPLRQEFVEQCGANYGTSADNYLSCGPYKIESWAVDTELVMVKNENYYDADKIHMDKITRLIITDPNTRSSMFDNGETDVTISVPASLKDHYDEDTLKIESAGTTTTLMVNMNGMTEETGKVLSNVNFIKALSYAIDRTALNNALANGTYEVATRLIDPAMPGSEEGTLYYEEYPDIAGAPASADPEKANEYLNTALEELGMTKEELPTFTYLCMEIGQLKLYAEAITDAWKNVLGLDCFDIVQYPVPTTIQNMLDGQYDIYWQQCGADLNDPNEYMSYWTTYGSINVSGWMDDTYTALIDKTETTLDRKERLSYFAEAEQYILDNGPHIPLFFFTNLLAVNPQFTGISYSSDMQYIYADYAG